MPDDDAPSPITRHVTKRDGRLEGEPEPDEDADASPELRAEEERQRDLTSLSGPGSRYRSRESAER